MEMKDKKKAQDIAEERMRLIAPLLAPGLDCAKMKSLKEEISRTFGVSVRTLERYCKVYSEIGYEGLQPAGKGNPPYKIPQELVQEAIQLRKELPSRSIPTIIHILEAEGILMGNSEFTPALDSPISVGVKSNDFVLCQMYREGVLTLDAVRQLRRNDRKLTYTRQQADKSIICRKEVITKDQFIDLIRDATVQIMF